MSPVDEVGACILLVALGAGVGWSQHGEEGVPAPAWPKVVAVIFADLHSAPCAEVNGLLDELAKARHLHIQKLFKHAPAHTDALAAHEAVLAAGAQGRFLEMHDLLFQQPKPAGSVLLELARTLGLDLARFETALDERQFRDVVFRDIAEARGLGVKTTPTVFVEGTRFEGLDALRSLVRGETRPAAPAWKSLAVETLQLDFIGSPSRGPPDAPVTLIEFTDFRCGFCQEHSQTLSQLTKNNGDIALIWSPATRASPTPCAAAHGMIFQPLQVPRLADRHLAGSKSDGRIHKTGADAPASFPS